jgi:DNA-binding transcriptional regulator YdaS (Cro superfamily)
MLLSKAADLIGRQKLASCLNISPALLDSWISGSGSVPDGKLMELALTMDKLSREEKQ